MAISAGLLLYRWCGDRLEVLLGHPGGPWFARRDDGAWSAPKGGVGPGETPQEAARREFIEEIGAEPPDPPWLDLGEIRQRSGKRVRLFAVEGDFDPADLDSNLFTMPWPPRSGTPASFPELDRVAWFGASDARRKLLSGQADAIDWLEAALA